MAYRHVTCDVTITLSILRPLGDENPTNAVIVLHLNVFAHLTHRFDDVKTFDSVWMFSNQLG